MYPGRQPSLLCCSAACRGGAREGTVRLTCSSLAHFSTNSHVKLGVSPTTAIPAIAQSKLWVSVFHLNQPLLCSPLSLQPALRLFCFHVVSEVAQVIRCLTGLVFLVDFFSLITWLLEFHAVWFSGTFGCSLILDWLLSSFWLCKELKDFYLHFHLVQNSPRTLLIWILIHRVNPCTTTPPWWSQPVLTTNDPEGQSLPLMCQ